MNQNATERCALAEAISGCAGYEYIDFQAANGGNVRAGMAYEGEDLNYQHCTITGGYELREVWIGGANWYLSLTEETLIALEAEAIAAMGAAA